MFVHRCMRLSEVRCVLMLLYIVWCREVMVVTKAALLGRLRDSTYLAYGAVPRDALGKKSVEGSFSVRVAIPKSGRWPLTKMGGTSCLPFGLLEWGSGGPRSPTHSGETGPTRFSSKTLWSSSHLPPGNRGEWSRVAQRDWVTDGCHGVLYGLRC